MFMTEEIDVRQEICWFYPNIGCRGDQKEAMRLYIHYDIIKDYAELLEETNPMFLD